MGLPIGKADTAARILTRLFVPFLFFRQALLLPEPGSRDNGRG
jgi:hypothetical protein